MKLYKNILIILIVWIIQISAFSQEIEAKSKNLAVGIALKSGISDINIKNIEALKNNGSGYNIGGGLLIERMFNNWFGIQSGLMCEYSKTYFIMNEGTTEEIEASWTSQSTSIPMLFITSLNDNQASVNFLIGMTYKNILITEMQHDDDDQIVSDNALKYTNSNQIGMTLGTSIKIHATKFSDFFIGFQGSYYPTNMLREQAESKEQIHSYDISVVSGWMFRTEIFPISKD